MMEKEIVVNLKQGLHARIATHFVRTSASFGSEISIKKNAQTADAKSIMGIMSMTVLKGDKVIITATGEDEKEAIMALEKFLLGEE
ncbi:HPr family phosphocarrier protein [Ammoniphilus sp. 3BR4]|uniref:HPr family phosphocarrier protein n=1 Tax=Ammoniphilus sp. 3BR4 TaxID=3158265 RepID=UPI0034677EC1